MRKNRDNSQKEIVRINYLSVTGRFSGLAPERINLLENLFNREDYKEVSLAR